MREKGMFAAEARRRDLEVSFHFLFPEDNYMECDPLPDPKDERDLTTFITLWREEKDKNIHECAKNCQTAENVINKMQSILGKAMASYDTRKIEWCYNYMNILRDIEFEKFDAITANMLENIEVYSDLSEEEKKKKEADANKGGSSKNQDTNVKPFFDPFENCKDINLGVFGKTGPK